MKEVKVGTHDGRFHMDEMLAIAIYEEYLRLCERTTIKEIVRSRNPNDFEDCDAVFDLGGVIDKEKKWYDHHQNDFDGKRDNGVKLAAAGIAWEVFGGQIVSKRYFATRDKAYDIVDQIIVQPVDAYDNCQFASNIDAVASLPHLIEFFNKKYNDSDVYEENEQFYKAYNVVKTVFQEVLIYAKSMEKAIGKVEELTKECECAHHFVADERLPMKDLCEYVHHSFGFYVFPDEKGMWRVEAIRKAPTSTEYRALLPVAWRGKRGAELEKITGVAGATFCHKSGFMAGAKTKEAAEKLAILG